MKNKIAMWSCRLLVKLFFVIGVISTPEHGLDQCTWLPDNNDTNSAKLSITCRMKSLYVPETNVTTLPTEITSRLRLVCNNELMKESVIPVSIIQKFHELTYLRISNCKLLNLEPNTFVGLYNLKELSINTHNSKWGRGKFFQLQTSSLNGLKELQLLDLSYSNIRSFPHGLFCTITNLHTLNITRNHIKDSSQFGFDTPECGNSELHHLDASYNNLHSLNEQSGFSYLRRMQTLNLSNNNITEISGESLAGLVSLKTINLSNNRIESLPQGLFAGSRELREIHLQNNSIVTLGRGIFQRLEQLLVLDLSGNALSSKHIDSGTFLGLIRLIVLNLSHNSLTHIDGRTFKDLFFLQILDLSNNSIGFIEDNAFLPLYNLHTLNLAENRLNTIGSFLFNGLFVLSKLTVNNNLISQIDVNAFHNCSALKDLDLSSNALDHVPKAIQELTFLKSLDLGENQISDFRNGSFKNLNQLTGLRLIDNNIGNLTVGMFWDLPSLQVLNLAKNKIQGIERHTFQRNTVLEAIRLDQNYISDIDGIFATIASLMWLNLSDNHLVWFDYAFIPKNLKWLDIHGNFIEHLNNYYKLQDDIRVKTLDASHNRITEISAMSIPNTIELLFINHNFIKSIHPNTFLDKTKLARVDMYSNEIENLDMSALRLTPFPENMSLPEIYIGGNPLNCDCNMEWMQTLNQTESRQYPKLMDLENVVCKLTYSHSGLTHLPFNKATSGDFLCTYKAHCFALCLCCEFDACDCEMTCPSGCTCYHDRTWNNNVVDCSKKNAVEIPQGIPMDATDVYLDGNQFSELQNHLFIGRKNMKVLFVNNSEIETIQNSTFNGLQALRILHLENNKLRELQGFEFEHLMNLEELYLHDNLISFVGNGTFELLRSLKILTLEGNKLTNFPLWLQTSHLPLTQLSLSRNPWSCRCKFVEEFTNWMSKNASKIIDIHDIMCVNSESKPVIETKIDFNNTICRDFLTGSVIDTMLISVYWPMILSLCLVIVLLLGVILWLIFRDTLRIWLFSSYGIRLCNFRATATRNFEDRDKLYDAFVCYSPKDEEWVTQALCSELESKFHLCLQYRDFPHTAYLQHAASTVLEAAEASRRVILVLTRNFLQTEWSRYELREAIHESLKGRVFKLLILEEGNLPEAYEDPELKPYLKTAHSVRWGEKLFWKRVYYVMPSAGPKNKNTHNYTRNINNYTIDSRVPNGTHHKFTEKFKAPQPPSPGVQMLPPPAYSQGVQEEDANYSSATTATPSPRPVRRVAPDSRPISDHIYSSIDSDYSTLERGGSGRRGPSWRPHVFVQASGGNGGGQAYLV